MQKIEQTMTRQEKKKILIEFESKVADLFEAGEINCPVHLSGGNEDYLISFFEGIKPHDYVFSTHRNHYHFLLRGGDPQQLMDELMGKPTGVCSGEGRSMHIYNHHLNFFTSGIVAGTPAIACGVGLAVKHDFSAKDLRPHVWCFVGDGAEDSGHFFEAARYAYCKCLPVTFIIEDNDLACDSDKKTRWSRFSEVSVGDVVIRYKYKRTYPHVGIGKHINF